MAEGLILTAAVELHPSSLSVLEVAGYLGVSRSTIYGLMDRGQLHNVKISGTRKIPREAFETYLREVNWDTPDDAA